MSRGRMTASAPAARAAAATGPPAAVVIAKNSVAATAPTTASLKTATPPQPPALNAAASAAWKSHSAFIQGRSGKVEEKRLVLTIAPRSRLTSPALRCQKTSASSTWKYASRALAPSSAASARTVASREPGSGSLEGGAVAADIGFYTTDDPPGASGGLTSR